MTPSSRCRLLLVVALALQVSASCYYPDGTYIADDRPCITNDTQQSFCCGQQGVICLSDKVCYQSDAATGYVRGSCTDRSFQSSACPNFCLTPSNKAGLMFQCGLLTDSYCCSPDGSPCTCEDSNVTLAAALSDAYSIAYIPPPSSATASETPVVPPSTTDSTIETFLSKATSTADLLAAPTQNPTLPDVSVISSTISTRTGAMPSGIRSSSSPSSSSRGNSREGAAIGIPVAILSVIILVLIALLVGHRRRTQSVVTKFLSQLANNRHSSRVLNEQQRFQMPHDIAAVEMDAQERRELVA